MDEGERVCGCPASHILMALHKLQQANIGCDLKICGSTNYIHIHRALLLARAAPHWSLKSQETFNFLEIQNTSIQVLVDYLYGLELKLTKENVSEIGLLGSSLELASVLALCDEFQSSRFSVEVKDEFVSGQDIQSSDLLHTSVSEIIPDNEKRETLFAGQENVTEVQNMPRVMNESLQEETDSTKRQENNISQQLPKQEVLDIPHGDSNIVVRLDPELPTLVQNPVATLNESALTSETLLTKTQTTHSAEPREKYKCKECGKVYRRELYLMRHEAVHKKNSSSSAKTFSCRRCPKSFHSRSLLDRHLSMHVRQTKETRQGMQNQIEKAGFKCKTCNKVFVHSRYLQAHQKAHMKASLECEECHMLFKWRSTLIKHRNVHQVNIDNTEHKCNVCQKTFKEAQYLKEHLNLHKPQQANTHVCSICGKIYLRKGPLEKHVLSHTGRKKCELCAEIFPSVSDLDNHRQTIHSDVVHKCQICNKTFKLAQYLKEHSKLHDPGGTAHRCSFCGKLFLRRASVEKHMRTHTGEKKCQICSEILPSKALLALHKQGTHPKCSSCGVMFKTLTLLRDHEKVHVEGTGTEGMPEQSVTRDGGTGVHTCSVCDKWFLRKDALETHIRTHTGEKKCQICSKILPSKAELALHKQAAHPNHPISSGGENEGFSCSTCLKTFTDKKKLNIHEKHHMNLSKMKCEICGKFMLSNNYERHMTIHRGEMDYQCDYCGKRFNQMASLNIHLPTHTGKMPHRCELCGRGTPTYSALIRHMRVHTGERPHTCHLCGLAFTEGHNLKKHLDRHDKGFVRKIRQRGLVKRGPSGEPLNFNRCCPPIARRTSKAKAMASQKSPVVEQNCVDI